jgi:AcrR family transcriptional regulator
MAARIADRPAMTGAIVRAATEVFAARGYGEATIDEIAGRAAIGKGTVYQYFRSKQDVFFAVFDAYVASLALLARESAVHETATAAARIRQSVRTVLEASAQDREMFPLVFEFWAASASPDRRKRVSAMFRSSYSRFRGLLARWIRQGQRTGEFDPRANASHIAAVLVGALDGLFLQVWFNPKLDAVSIGDEFIGVLLRGLAPPRKTAAHKRSPLK